MVLDDLDTKYVMENKHLTYFLQCMTCMDGHRCQYVFLCAHRKMNLEGRTGLKTT
jgi:hypothetical protein